MADELTISMALRFLVPGEAPVELGREEGVQKIDVSGTESIRNVQTVGFAAEELLEVGDVGTYGYFMGINRDPTNIVEMRGASGEEDLVRFEPGELNCFRLAQDAVPYVQATTAACRLEYVLIPD
jgi:hypothetical protein